MIEIKCRDIYGSDDVYDEEVVIDSVDEFILMSYSNEQEKTSYQLTLKANVHNCCLNVMISEQEYKRLKEMKCK